MASSSSRASLPNELWAKIGSHLAADRFSTTRFRSVCRSWRTLIPKFHHSSAPPLTRFSLPLPLLPRPFFRLRYPSVTSVDVFVSDSPIHRIERPSACGRRGWLVQVERLSEDEIRIIDPLTCNQIKNLMITDLQPFSLSEFRLSEILARSFALRFSNKLCVAGVNKLVLNTRDSNSAFLIYENGILGFVRDGDKELSVVDGRIFDYHDVVIHRGQPYVVDSWGTVSWIDSGLNLVKFSPPIGLGGRKHLVVLAGELFVIDRTLEEAAPDEIHLILASNYSGNRRFRGQRSDCHWPRPVEFKVFKLDEEWGRWTEVKSLGENSLVLAHDCSFAVAAADFYGFEANCIYFAEQLDTDRTTRDIHLQGAFVFRLGDGSIEKLKMMPGYFNMLSQADQPRPDGSWEVSMNHSRT